MFMREDDLPTNKYLQGRITNVFPDADGKVRLLKIKTAWGIIKRSMSKIALLPQQIYEN